MNCGMPDCFMEEPHAHGTTVQLRKPALCPPFTSVEVNPFSGVVVALGSDGRVYASAHGGGWIRCSNTYVDEPEPILALAPGAEKLN